MTECPHCGKEVYVSVVLAKHGQILPMAVNEADEVIRGGGVPNKPKMGKCNRCGEGIYWHQSKKTGKWYSTNTEDYRDFHRQTCTGSEG